MWIGSAVSNRVQVEQWTAWKQSSKKESKNSKYTNISISLLSHNCMRKCAHIQVSLFSLIPLWPFWFFIGICGIYALQYIHIGSFNIEVDAEVQADEWNKGFHSRRSMEPHLLFSNCRTILHLTCTLYMEWYYPFFDYVFPLNIHTYIIEFPQLAVSMRTKRELRQQQWYGTMWERAHLSQRFMGRPWKCCLCHAFHTMKTHAQTYIYIQCSHAALPLTRVVSKKRDEKRAFNLSVFIL